mmetsp:Transcript_44652/g.83208  ORF Transcript_44652/g.83208 Transcript_44652/m.83208 type:complete len:242 (+) Transcript_44652:1180-1905(+)
MCPQMFDQEANRCCGNQVANCDATPNVRHEVRASLRSLPDPLCILGFSKEVDHGNLHARSQEAQDYDFDLQGACRRHPEHSMRCHSNEAHRHDVRCLLISENRQCIAEKAKQWFHCPREHDNRLVDLHFRPHDAVFAEEEVHGGQAEAPDDALNHPLSKRKHAQQLPTVSLEQPKDQLQRTVDVGLPGRGQRLLLRRCLHVLQECFRLRQSLSGFLRALHVSAIARVPRGGQHQPVCSTRR